MTLAGLDFCSLIGGVLVGAAILGFIVAQHWDEECKQAAERIRAEVKAEFTERERQAGALEAKNRKWHDELEKWKQAEEKRIAAEDERLHATRRATDEEERRVTRAVQAATAMAHDLPAGGAHEAASKRLRELHLKGFCYGKFLTVTFLGSIDGFIRLRWSIQLDRPQPPRLEIGRDGHKIATGHSFNGEHGDYLEPGSRPCYRFELFDERNALLDSVTVELALPPISVWSLDVAALPNALTSDTERDGLMRKLFSRQVNSLKLVHELAEAAHNEIETWTIADDLKEWAKSQVDALAAELREGAAAS